MAERFDRSAIDILLNGTEAEVRVPAARQATFKIRSDPALLPLDMVRAGTEEYHLFAPKRRLIVGPLPSMAGHQPPYPSMRERLPQWIPSKIKWPLEDALSRLLGESPEQRPWLLQMEVSWPHGQRWYYGMGLWVLCPLLAWIAGMSLATVLAGWLVGVVHGIFLRVRMEKRFDWSTDWVGLVGTIVALCLVVHFSEASHSWREWTVGAMLWKPLGGCLGAVKWPLVLYVSLGLPFYQDQNAARYSNDVVVMFMFTLTLVYASNFCLPLGIWCGAVLNMIHPTTLSPLPPMLPPPRLVAAAGEGLQVPSMLKGMVDTPLQQQQQQQHQLQQQQLQYIQQQQQMQALYRQQDPYGISPNAADAGAAGGGGAVSSSANWISPSLISQSPQQQQRVLLQQQQWLLQQHLQQLQQPPMTERESLRAAAALLKLQQEGTSNHPRRWLKPEEEDVSSNYTSSMSPFPSGSSRRRSSLSGRMQSLDAGGGEGAGVGEGDGLYGGGGIGRRNRWSGGRNGEGRGGGQWGEEAGKGGQDGGRRYGLRSRRGRRVGGGELEPTAMDLSSSPPPPTPLDFEDFVSDGNNGMYGRRGGIGGGRVGRYETLNPNR